MENAPNMNKNKIYKDSKLLRIGITKNDTKGCIFFFKVKPRKIKKQSVKIIINKITE